MSLAEVSPLAERPPRIGPWAPYALSLVLVGLASLLAVAVDRRVAIPNVSLSTPRSSAALVSLRRVVSPPSS